MSTNREKSTFRDALDEIIDVLNEIEPDKPLIAFDDDVIRDIEKTKVKFEEKETNE